MKVILVLVYILNLLSILYMIFEERRNANELLVWIFILNIMPIVGFVLFLIMGRRIHRPNMFGIRKKEDDALTIYSIKTIATLKNSTKEVIKKHSDMVKSLVSVTHAPFTDDNDIEFYTESKDFFGSLLRAIKEAQESIHIQFYIFKDDNIGKEILEVLKKKAESGVEVRFLYDSVGSRGLKRETLKSLKNSGVKVGEFFPSWFKVINLNINYRNHRKIVVIDNSIGFVGGYNVGDEYLGRNKRFGNWRDTHIRIIGSSVKDLNLRFLTDWRYTTGENIKLEYVLKNNSNYVFEGDKGVQIVSSGPDLVDKDEIKLGYLKMFQKAKKYIYIQSPYLILDTSVIDSLKIASLSGIDVKIMIPGKPDHPFVYWANLSYAGDLMKYGVKVYHYDKDSFLHSKTVVVDDEICSIGTANLDIRSFELNFEVNAFVYSKELSLKQRRAFDEDLKISEEVIYEDYKNRNVIVKIKESISRLFSPLL